MFSLVIQAQVGGSKYIYPLCKLLAATIWKRFFLLEPLDRKAGRRVKQLLFQAGGHFEPTEVLRGLLGRDAVIEVQGGGHMPNLLDDVYQDIEMLG